MLRTILAAFLAATLATQANAEVCSARPSDTKSPLPPAPWSKAECPVTCKVTYSPGGFIVLFKQAAEAIKSDHRRLMIAGPCVSACTIAADKARPFVCITANASFKFHRGFEPDEMGYTRRIDIADEYSHDIQGWLTKKGGLPGKDACDPSLLTMTFREARRFFPVCSGED